MILLIGNISHVGLQSKINLQKTICKKVSFVLEITQNTIHSTVHKIVNVHFLNVCKKSIMLI